MVELSLRQPAQRVMDPAVDFGLQFQAIVEDDTPAEHDDATNDGSADGDGPDLADIATSEDGSNVVTVDFGRKK